MGLELRDGLGGVGEREWSSGWTGSFLVFEKIMLVTLKGNFFFVLFLYLERLSK